MSSGCFSCHPSAPYQSHHLYHIPAHTLRSAVPDHPEHPFRRPAILVLLTVKSYPCQCDCKRDHPRKDHIHVVMLHLTLLIHVNNETSSECPSQIKQNNNTRFGCHVRLSDVRSTWKFPCSSLFMMMSPCMQVKLCHSTRLVYIS